MSYSTQKSIVVIDDTPENLRLLIEMLSKQGYRVRPAPDGILGLNSIRKEPPDLILLDIVMPDMNGYEVCRQLKKDEALRDIPVIFISALNEVFDKVTAFNVGGVDYITKPFQVEEVIARVNTHINLRDVQKRLEEQNEELEAFAHTAAHDLKGPLGTIMGALNILTEDRDQLADDMKTLVDLGSTTANKMNNIIDELMLLASVRKEDIPTAPVNMQDHIYDSLTRLDPMIAQYDAEIIVSDDLPRAVGYGPWVEEVWVNYISNGMKYGGTPPRLQVGGDALDDHTIRFWVMDNGDGLDEVAQTALFTEFSRLDTIRAQGHGLGLSIVRRIVGKLGGHVGMENVPGAGSRFYFTLPAHK